jgi:hypothetical protein
MFYLSWIIAFACIVAASLSIPFGVFALAISPAKGQTFKRMFLAFIIVGPMILLVGFLAAELLESHALARLTGMFCGPLGLLAGTIAGWNHARSLRKHGPAFPSVSIRG